MEKCCRTCKWFRGGDCTLDEMSIDLEGVLDEVIINMKEGITNPMVLNVIDVIGDAIIERSVGINFIPPDYDEFYCKYYE